MITTYTPHPKTVLAIDWNSTIQNQIGQICDLSHGLLRPADFDQWDPQLGHKVGMTEEMFTKWAWTSPLIQWRAKPYPGAAQAITTLRECYQIVILTSTSNPDLVPGWLKREGIPYDKIIFTGDKGMVKWDTLIDDSPTTLARLHLAARRVIRWSLPWNAHLDCIPCVHSWLEVEWLLSQEQYFWPGVMR